MFRAILQTSNQALKGLTASLLHMEPEEITTVEITNPIELGTSIGAKEFILDIRALLNGTVKVNMEMQILNLGNWPERSLGYLCRSFDSLNSGQEYLEVKPVIQICFLDFTLFPENPEFYSTYMFKNIKNNTIYSDKIRMSVVDLTKTDNATEEDQRYGIDNWAKLFKATTWEELKEMSEQSDFLREASEAYYRLSEDEKIRLQCEARMEYEREQSYIRYKMNQLEAAEERLVEVEQKLTEGEKQLKESEKQLKESEKQLKVSEKQLAERDRQLALMQAELEELRKKVGL